ncbi:MAG: hypothetical protein FWE70_00415 [Oscillospiraceae bacterium]|nr:hypothetical protein [Oscillospiraceae bacterium]
MDYVRRMPWILGLFASIVTGLLCHSGGCIMEITFFRMAIALFLFFCVGLVIRAVITGIQDELRMKEELEARRAEEGLGPLGEAAEAQVDADAASAPNGSGGYAPYNGDGGVYGGNGMDEFQDGFEPMKIADYLKGETEG